MKTLTDLNKKWWYRLIKILYFAIYAIIFFSSIVIVISRYPKEFDTYKIQAECDSGSKVNLAENGILLYSKNVSSDKSELIRRLCLSNTQIGQIAKETYSKTGWPEGLDYNKFSDEELGLRLKKSSDGRDFISSIYLDSDNYSITAPHKPINWKAILGHSFIVTLTVVIVFELTRRLFYYVITGFFSPEEV